MASTASWTRNIGALAALSAAVACVGLWSAATFGVGGQPGATDAALAATADASAEKEPSGPAAVTVETGPTEEMSAESYGYVGTSGPDAQRDSRRYYYYEAYGPDGSSRSRQQKAVEQIEAALDKDLQTASLQGTKRIPEFARALQEQLGVPVVVDRRSLEDVGMTPDTELDVDLPEKGLSARSFLRLVLDQYDLEYVIADEVLLITTPEEAEMRLETLVYSTREVAIPAEDLSQIITQTVAPESWEDVGGPGTVCTLPEEANGLVISQTQRVHEQIADLLEQLRRNAGDVAPTRAYSAVYGGYSNAPGQAGAEEKRRMTRRTPPTTPGESRPVFRSRLPARVPPAPATPGEPSLRIDFRSQPWKDVLEWFASTQSLSLVIDAMPPGVLNYSDPQPKSAQQVMELFNSVLVARGYALVAYDNVLRVVELQRPEGGVAPAD